MSTTAEDHASELETYARLARAVAERFPRATLGVLVEGGGRVYLAYDIGADRVEIVCDKNTPMIFTYVEVKSGTDSVRVYENRHHERYARSVLADLLKENPDVYAAIVAKADRR